MCCRFLSWFRSYEGLKFVVSFPYIILLCFFWVEGLDRFFLRHVCSVAGLIGLVFSEACIFWPFVYYLKRLRNSELKRSVLLSKVFLSFIHISGHVTRLKTYNLGHIN